MKKALIISLSTIAGLIILALISALVIRTVGKSRLKNSTVETHPVIITEETALAAPEEKEKWEEGWIKYNGKVYEYNDDIMTFLFMGVDKNGKVKQVAEGTNGGQADALFLLVLDSKKETISVIGINRNTMTDVDVYNEYGDYVTTTKAQIAVQHGFGNGVEESCEYQVDAVRKLMYQLPIHGYAAINMKAIPIINDAVGGVNLQAIEDIYKGKKKIISEGDNVHLKGEEAYLYLRDRDEDEFASSDRRLARQKQYLTIFLAQAKSAVKNDIGVVSELYKDITPYMTTNVSFDEVAYLAPEVSGYQFSESSFYMIEGETKMGEEFEEFYPDEQALYDLIIKVFYREVDTNK
jgi:LCP family protein required for cell wall assembly